jgi:hypothetical protein
MSILLQNRDTGQYVRLPGDWTQETGEAHRFTTTVEALCFCHERNLFRMQMLVGFADGRQEIAIHVTDSRLVW